jgi:hypothetical protein
LTLPRAEGTIAFMTITAKNGRAAPPSTNGVNGPGTLPSAAPAGGRDGQGRFTPGNAGGSGNPFFRQVAQFRRAVLAATSPDDAAAVMRRMRDLALTGEPAVAVAAAKVYFERAVGKPAQPASPDAVDLEEVRLLLQRPLAEQVLMCGAGAVPADLAADWLRLVAAVRGDRALQVGDEDDDDPEAVARAAALCQLRDQILQARARTT